MDISANIYTYIYSLSRNDRVNQARKRDVKGNTRSRSAINALRWLVGLRLSSPRRNLQGVEGQPGCFDILRKDNAYIYSLSIFLCPCWCVPGAFRYQRARALGMDQFARFYATPKNKTANHPRYHGCSGRSPNGNWKGKNKLMRDKERNDKEIEATTELLNAKRLIIVCQQCQRKYFFKNILLMMRKRRRGTLNWVYQLFTCRRLSGKKKHLTLLNTFVYTLVKSPRHCSC